MVGPKCKEQILATVFESGLDCKQSSIISCCQGHVQTCPQTAMSKITSLGFVPLLNLKWARIGLRTMYVNVRFLTAPSAASVATHLAQTHCNHRFRTESKKSHEVDLVGHKFIANRWVKHSQLPCLEQSPVPPMSPASPPWWGFRFLVSVGRFFSDLNRLFWRKNLRIGHDKSHILYIIS